jgi:hypothetical protein
MARHLPPLPGLPDLSGSRLVLTDVQLSVLGAYPAGRSNGLPPPTGEGSMAVGLVYERLQVT